MTGIDDALKLEAVYLSAPVPRNLGVLTVLGVGKASAGFRRVNAGVKMHRFAGAKVHQ